MDEESPDTPGPAAYKMDDNAEAKIYTRYGKNCACLALESPVCPCRPLLTRTCLHMQTWATTTALGRSTTGNNGRKRMHTGVASSQSKAAKVGRQSEWLTQRQAQTRRRTRFRGRSDLTTESEAGTPPVFYAPRAGWAALQVALCVGCLVGWCNTDERNLMIHLTATKDSELWAARFCASWRCTALRAADQTAHLRVLLHKPRVPILGHLLDTRTRQCCVSK